MTLASEKTFVPKWPVIATGLLLIPLASPAVAGPLLGPTTAATAGTRPHAVRIADLNGDHRPDVIVTNAWSNSVSILLGNGDGSVQAKRDYSVGPSGTTPKTAEPGDLNEDGIPDLVSANQNASSVSVLIGNGDGSFRPRVAYPTAALSSHEADVGDINGDGHLDVAVVGWGASVLAIKLGNGNGTLATETVYATGAKPYSVTIEDLNGDGHNDVAVANYNGASVSVFLNNGHGVLQPQVQYPTLGGPHSVRAADLDHDGDLDIVTANDWTNRVAVLPGHGDGTFGARLTFPTGITPKSVFITDLNLDGHPDLITANAAKNYPTLVNTGPDNSISVLLGVGNATFLPRTDYSGGLGPYSVAAGDLNCDGAPDVVRANYWGANAMIQINQLGSLTSCP